MTANLGAGRVTSLRTAEVTGWLLALCVGYAMAAEDEILRLPPGRSPPAFAASLIPAGMKAAHPTVSGRVGPFRDALIVLFHADDYREFHGWVFTPEGGGYRKYELPDAPQPVSTEVRAVFFADAGHDGRRELFILARHISGVGGYPANVRPFCNTYPYAWEDGRFVFLEDLAATLDRCDAAGVRSQIDRYRRRR